MLTEKQIKFIKENYMTMSNQELADKIGSTKFIVNNTLGKLGLSRRERMTLLEGEYFISLSNLGFSRYKVSNKGRFINEDNLIIKSSFTPDGYLGIKMVNDEGKRVTNRSHRIVALAFIPNDDPINKVEVNHKDGNKENIEVSNLEWSTPSENQKHAYRNNLRTAAKGTKSKLATHSEEEVRNICICISKGMRTKDILVMYPDTNRSWIDGIRFKRRWKEISDEYF